ncbi:hypothetical protein HPP92_010055 [Vanilla planifolia]|uniref:Uncharacterized protein n=1 Tax=Vanilla planifolia TaxID=51239 RepID=A0A835R5C5_VANPL|nr:hypothetical protein HPP92_010055 [Vanilla planifolia]
MSRKLPLKLVENKLDVLRTCIEAFLVRSMLKPRSPARSQLDLLQQLTSSTDRQVYESEVDRARPTIREQLADLSRGRNGDFTLPLGEKLKESLKSLNILTISRRRNIKRQEYLNIVSGRNDAVFFATIGAFVFLPPLAILAVAIQNGYVQLFH